MKKLLALLILLGALSANAAIFAMDDENAWDDDESAQYDDDDNDKNGFYPDED